jgi:hypothetical protein
MCEIRPLGAEGYDSRLYAALIMGLLVDVRDQWRGY